jgi:hypothetical protein
VRTEKTGRCPTPGTLFFLSEGIAPEIRRCERISRLAK